MYTLVNVSYVYLSKTWKEGKAGFYWIFALFLSIRRLRVLVRTVSVRFKRLPTISYSINKGNIKPYYLRHGHKELRSICESALSNQTIRWSHGTICCLLGVLILNWGFTFPSTLHKVILETLLPILWDFYPTCGRVKVMWTRWLKHWWLVNYGRFGSFLRP